MRNAVVDISCRYRWVYKCLSHNTITKKFIFSGEFCVLDGIVYFPENRKELHAITMLYRI
jgi:hypothetical protein